MPDVWDRLEAILSCDDPYDCTDSNGLHCHECPKCKAIWQHPEGSNYMAAHYCPRCGEHQAWKMSLSSVKKRIIDFPWELPKHDHKISTGIACYSCGTAPRP